MFPATWFHGVRAGRAHCERILKYLKMRLDQIVKNEVRPNCQRMKDEGFDGASRGSSGRPAAGSVKSPQERTKWCSVPTVNSMQEPEVRFLSNTSQCPHYNPPLARLSSEAVL